VRETMGMNHLDEVRSAIDEVIDPSEFVAALQDAVMDLDALSPDVDFYLIQDGDGDLMVRFRTNIVGGATRPGPVPYDGAPVAEHGDGATVATEDVVVGYLRIGDNPSFHFDGGYTDVSSVEGLLGALAESLRRKRRGYHVRSGKEQGPPMSPR
jgi:hypothetical protein